MANHDPLYASPVYTSQGGDELHLVASATAGAGALLQVGTGNGLPVGVVPTFTPAQGAANVCLLSVQWKDGKGNNIAYPMEFDILLSDAATGAGLTAVTASGAVGAGASGVDLGTLTTKKALRVQTTAAGLYILSITDTAKTAFFPVAYTPFGTPVVGTQLATGNYG